MDIPNFRPAIWIRGGNYNTSAEPAPYCASVGTLRYIGRVFGVIKYIIWISSWAHEFSRMKYCTSVQTQSQSFLRWLMTAPLRCEDEPPSFCGTAGWPRWRRKSSMHICCTERVWRSLSPPILTPIPHSIAHISYCPTKSLLSSNISRSLDNDLGHQCDDAASNVNHDHIDHHSHVDDG